MVEDKNHKKEQRRVIVSQSSEPVIVSLPVLCRNMNNSMVLNVSIYASYVIHVIDDQDLSLMYHFMLR